MKITQPLFANLTAFNVALALTVMILAWLAVRYQAKLFDRLADRFPRSRFLAKMAEPVVRVTFWFVATLIIAGIMAPSQDAFLAALGSIALAVGLGAQDLIKNIIGGLMIIAIRPFQVGDRVKIGDAYGEVVQIGLQTTQIVTPGDTKVTIPNATVLNSMSWNANSGVPDAQVQTELFLPATADPETALTIGRQVATTSPYTLLSKPYYVSLIDAYTESPYLVLRIRAYVYDHRFEPAMMSDFTRRAKRELARAGLLDW